METILDIPYEVKKIIERETDKYKNYTAGYIMDNYKYGPSDLLVRFHNGQLQIISNMEAFERRDLIQIRAKLLSSIYAELHQNYLEDFDGLDLVIPICFSDTTDVRFQDIPCLTFSRTTYSNNILIPSVDALVGYKIHEIVNGIDTPLFTKEEKMCFVASLTGRIDGDHLKNNQRLKIAKLASEDIDDKYFCRIIKPPKHDGDEFNDLIKKVIELFPSISSTLFLNQDDRFSMKEQLKYRFQICVDGHTCAWSRLPWQMLANVIPLKIRNPKFTFMEWFYPLIDTSKHCLEIDIIDIDDAYRYLVKHPEVQMEINEAGRLFVNKYLNRDMAIKVFGETLLTLNKKQDNSYFVEDN